MPVSKQVPPTIDRLQPLIRKVGEALHRQCQELEVLQLFQVVIIFESLNQIFPLMLFEDGFDRVADCILKRVEGDEEFA